MNPCHRSRKGARRKGRGRSSPQQNRSPLRHDRRSESFVPWRLCVINTLSRKQTKQRRKHVLGDQAEGRQQRSDQDRHGQEKQIALQDSLPQPDLSDSGSGDAWHLPIFWKDEPQSVPMLMHSHRHSWVPQSAHLCASGWRGVGMLVGLLVGVNVGALSLEMSAGGSALSLGRPAGGVLWQS